MAPGPCGVVGRWAVVVERGGLKVRATPQEGHSMVGHCAVPGAPVPRLSNER